MSIFNFHFHFVVHSAIHVPLIVLKKSTNIFWWMISPWCSREPSAPCMLYIQVGGEALARVSVRVVHFFGNHDGRAVRRVPESARLDLCVGSKNARLATRTSHGTSLIIRGSPAGPVPYFSGLHPTIDTIRTLRYMLRTRLFTACLAQRASVEHTQTI